MGSSLRNPHAFPCRLLTFLSSSHLRTLCTQPPERDSTASLRAELHHGAAQPLRAHLQRPGPYPWCMSNIPRFFSFFLLLLSLLSRLPVCQPFFHFLLLSLVLSLLFRLPVCQSFSHFLLLSLVLSLLFRLRVSHTFPCFSFFCFSCPPSRLAPHNPRSTGRCVQYIAAEVCELPTVCRIQYLATARLFLTGDTRQARAVPCAAP